MKTERKGRKEACASINIVLAFFGRVIQAGVWHSLVPFVFRCPSQDVVFVCVKYSGKPDALLQGKEEKECQRKV